MVEPAGDLVPFKGRADVILVGHAYAPHGRPVSTLTARLDQRTEASSTAAARASSERRRIRHTASPTLNPAMA